MVVILRRKNCIRGSIAKLEMLETKIYLLRLLSCKTEIHKWILLKFDNYFNWLQLNN